MKTRDEFLEAKDEILDEFDFQKLHTAMMAVGWEWYFDKENYGVPNVRTLVREAEILLLRVIDKRLNEGAKNTTVGTGGFNAWVEGDTIGLNFTIESWTV